MLKFDFSTYMNTHVNIDQDKKLKIIEKLKQDKMAGFIRYQLSDQQKMQIIDTACQIRQNSDVFIVIGIGGSFMGSYAMKHLFLPTFKNVKTEVIYLGQSLSEIDFEEVVNYIKDKEVALNVISKSGTTLEIQLIYHRIKEELKKKYSKEELQKRIIITTDRNKGLLREEVNKEGFLSFEIPEDIGGRYSLMTPAHLLPMAVMDLDIFELFSGFQEGLNLIDEAYYYANLRIELFKQKKYIENFSVYEPKLYYYTEWLKQLFGESEGKENCGIFPVSTVNTRDLHSLGQFIQQGNPILFETVIQVINDKINNSNSFESINKDICEAVCRAHYQENTPSIIISMDGLTLKNIGCLSSFMMLAAAFSAYLFNVNPFTQPGVEAYKRELKHKVN